MKFPLVLRSKLLTCESEKATLHDALTTANHTIAVQEARIRKVEETLEECVASNAALRASMQVAIQRNVALQYGLQHGVAI